MEISIIAAIGASGELGLQNKLLWHIKEDFEWFKKHTYNKPVVMGRLTYESIGKPLKGRINVVISRDSNFRPDSSVLVYQSIEEVLYEFRNEKELMVIGGASIYNQFIPYTTRMYITEIASEFTADAFFPEIQKDDWFNCFRRKGIEDVGFSYSFNVYKKKLN